MEKEKNIGTQMLSEFFNYFFLFESENLIVPDDYLNRFNLKGIKDGSSTCACNATH